MRVTLYFFRGHGDFRAPFIAFSLYYLLSGVGVLPASSSVSLSISTAMLAIGTFLPAAF